jgi:DNA-binding MarR family transcriptional regulator
VMELDRIIHEPVRLQIMATLGGVDTADFKFLVSTLGLSKGNLSSHVDKLEVAGYVQVTKSFNGKITYTQYALTPKGRKALEKHWMTLDKLRAASNSKRKSE